MTLPDAHLLRLPREVRDQILADLDLRHEVSFDWKWKVKGMHRVDIRVTIPHAPRTSLLLVCSRVHDENRELLQHSGTPSRVILIEWNGNIVRRQALKSLMKNMKLMLAFDYPTTVLLKITSSLSWVMTADLLDVLQANMPQISSVTITTRLSGSEYFVTPHIDEHLDWRPLARENARPIPDMLGDLYVQRKSCLYRIGTVMNTYYREPSPRLKGNKPREISWTRFYYTDRNYPVAHYITRFEAYIYTREGVKVPKLDAEALSAFWPTTDFTVEDLDPDWDLPEKYVRMMKEYAGRLVAWEEVDREDLMASFQTFCLWRKQVITEKKNVNEDEGFALWFDQLGTKLCMSKVAGLETDSVVKHASRVGT
jgi:hypothetical protein